MKETESRRGFSATELVVTLAIAAILLAIAIPFFGERLMAMSFARTEEAVTGLLSRARWAAINSGRFETRVWLETGVLRIREGTAANGAIVAELDVSGIDDDIAVTATNLPIRYDSRGMRLNPVTPTITIANSRITASRTLSINPLGKYL